MVNNVNNPFTVGRPVNATTFVGRTSEIATALDQITSRGNLAIWGSPGIGKSSFLNLLADNTAWTVRGYDPGGAIILYLSCLSLTPFSATAFWREILEQLQDLVDPELKPEIATLLAQTPTKESLRKVLALLGKRQQYLVLLADDYDAALRPTDSYSETDMVAFVSDCRNLTSHAREREHLSMVVTSLRRLNDLGPRLQPGSSPWYNHYLFLPLKPFPETDTAILLAGLPMTPGLRDGIREMSDGHPALLQNAGHLLFRELRSGQVPNPIAFARDFRTATSHLFEAQWNLASDIEQTLMMLLALLNLKGKMQQKQYDLGDITMVFSQKERELLNLVDQGVLIQRGRAGDRFPFAFASSMMEWWVVEELENSNEAWLGDRQKVFLNLMSHRQAQTVTAAIQWLWGHRDQLPSIVEWLAKVSSAFPKGLM
jgi:AAA ATPase domain